jgi:hypothetical protein
MKGAEGVPPQKGTGNENNTSKTSVEDSEGADAEDAIGEPSDETGGKDPTALRRLLQVLLHTTQKVMLLTLLYPTMPPPFPSLEPGGGTCI